MRRIVPEYPKLGPISAPHRFSGVVVTPCQKIMLFDGEITKESPCQ